MLVNGTYRAEVSNTTAWIATVDNYDTPDDKAHKIRATAICKR